MIELLHRLACLRIVAVAGKLHSEMPAARVNTDTAKAIAVSSQHTACRLDALVNFGRLAARV